MKIKELSLKAREIWGDEKLPLSQIIVRLGKVFGDICRWERNAFKDKEIHNNEELQKELGNLIFSTIKFCDELGYDPEDCIKKAVEAQEKYVKNNKVE
jgi:NTP pyrophosphatase (non-canonical NTP hydrolase)